MSNNTKYTSLNGTNTNDFDSSIITDNNNKLESTMSNNYQTKTILTYSEKNPSFMGQQTITKPVNTNNNNYLSNNSNSQSNVNPLDILNDDYALSNQLNDVHLSNSIELHYFVYHNDLTGVKKFIEKHRKQNRKNLGDYLSIRDVHGNTPLHLAAMLGNYDVAKILVDNGATVKARNRQMWTPLNESVSFGNRDLIRCILKKFEKEVEDIVNSSKPKITSALQEMKDFYVEIKWDFESWIPLVSRFLPSDVCKLYKKGSKLRVDCTLGDIARNSVGGTGNSGSTNENGISSPGASSPFSWQRGDLSFIFEIDKIGDKNSILFLDNKRKTFVRIDKQGDLEEEHDIEKEVDLLLSREMIYLKLDTRSASFLPTQVGWFSKRDKVEPVNSYLCQFYDVSNLFIVSKLRSEHLSEEELKRKEEKQKKIKEKLTSSAFSRSKSSNESFKSIKSTDSNEMNDQLDQLDDIEIDENIEYRPNLPPPPKNIVSWNEYINSSEGDWPCLGRKPRCKESRKEFKAQLAMSQEFPLTVQDLNKLLDALVPLAKFRKLKEFINLKLPPGFPVKIDIPIVPTITAKVSFQNFKKDCAFNDKLFTVPDDFVEENLSDTLNGSVSKEKQKPSPDTTSSTVNTF